MKKDFYEIMKKDFTLSLFNELKVKDILPKILSVITFKIYVFNILFIAMLFDIITSNSPTRRAIEVLLMTIIFFKIQKQYNKKKSVKFMLNKKVQVSVEEMVFHFLQIFSPLFMNKAFEVFKSKNISASMRFEILNSDNKNEIDKIITYKDVIRVIKKENPEKIKLI